MEFATRDDAKIWIIKNQFGRRNLAPFTRVELALLLEPLLKARAKQNSGTRTDLLAKLPTGSQTKFCSGKTAGTKVRARNSPTTREVRWCVAWHGPQSREGIGEQE